MKVYLVTTGSYSDYRVRAVCSTEEKAKHILNTCFATYETAQIDEWDVDPPLILPPLGCRFFRVFIARDGSVRSVEPFDDDEAQACLYKPDRWLQFWHGEPAGVLYTEVTARSEEHAIKIANEQRLVLIASDQWKPDLAEWPTLPEDA